MGDLDWMDWVYIGWGVAVLVLIAVLNIWWA